MFQIKYNGAEKGEKLNVIKKPKTHVSQIRSS